MLKHRKILLVCASLLCGCSAQQLYGSAQAWQKQECNKIVDTQERGRCMASTNASYEEYQRQRQAGQAPP